MSEKRQFKRHRRRMNIRFGEKEFSGTGFTYDVSATGMFLVTNQMSPIKARLHVQMFLDTTRFVCFEAEVRRQKIVPMNLRTVEKGGMGLRLLTPSELMRELFDAGRLRVTLTYSTLAAFQAGYERELKHGGVLLRAQRVLPASTRLVVEVALPFIPATVELEGTVVAPGPGGPGDSTAQVAFEAADAVAQLKIHLTEGSGNKPL